MSNSSTVLEAIRQRPTPSRRMRARRLRVDDLNLGATTARARHTTLGDIDGRVFDLSLTGLAIAIPNAAASQGLALVGDRLNDLVVQCPTGILYEGTASVRRVADNGPDLVLGAELDFRGIDLGLVYRLGTRHGFAERFQAVVRSTEATRIFAEFKAWVADLHAYLLTTQDFLNAEERGLEGLDQLTRDQTLQEYLAEATPLLVTRMNQASRELADFASRLSDDQHPHYRAYFRGHLLPIFRASPLLRRAFDKPLGYAGDYEMMNMLYREHAEGDSLFARALNVYGAQEPAAVANINRLEYLGEKIAEMARQREGRIRIASIGCGPAREITQLLERNPELGSRLEVALIDQERRAIGFCERTLGPLAAQTGAKVQFIEESVRRLLTARKLSATLGQRELIYSAGLFDYLNTRSVSALLGALYEALVPGGTLFVGNVAAHNPTRYFMEYCLDWFLIHRSPEELLGFAEALVPQPSVSDVEAEPLGVNLFLRVVK
jgi:extracellular factor (EF) 3-hydroxypalmitic acid methyl ester biosynthesis protein